MSEDKPSKADLVAVFRKLRAQAPNKACFDCGANNPTWASVTYGVFICIDCSATHRGLGVHLTFVRSTTLDTNWTWLQMRAMQLGGNINATQFFRQHGCTTTDAQQKYHSRAATLYRDKLHGLCTQAMRLHGSKLHIEAGQPASPANAEGKEDTFWTDHASPVMSRNESEVSLGKGAMFANTPPISDNNDSDAPGPKVEGLDMEAKPSKLGAKKVIKTSKLGAKKGKLGATKVTADFTQIEQEAAAFDKEKEEAAAKILFAAKEPEKEEVGGLSARLMVQDISGAMSKEEERLRSSDPHKAGNVERLGMGVKAARGGVSHSLVSDMVEIKQEGSTSAAKLGGQRVSLTRDRDTYRAEDDDWELVKKEPKSGFGDDGLDGLMGGGRKDTSDDFFSAYSGKSTSNWESKEDRKPKRPPAYDNEPVTRGSGVTTEEKLKQYANSKAISSDQFFDKGADYETRANLAKYEGASSIGSADLFGNGQSNSGGGGYGASAHMPDMSDVKEGVRQGVSRVAGKISSLSSSMSSYISDNYSGY